MPNWSLKCLAFPPIGTVKTLSIETSWRVETRSQSLFGCFRKLCIARSSFLLWSLCVFEHPAKCLSVYSLPNSRFAMFEGSRITLVPHAQIVGRRVIRATVWMGNNLQMKYVHSRRGGGGFFKTFYTGRLHAAIQTLTFLFTIYERKETACAFIHLP